MKILGVYVTTVNRRQAELDKISEEKAEAEKVRQSLVLTLEANFKKHVENERISTGQVQKLMDQNINLIGKVTALRGKGTVNLS